MTEDHRDQCERDRTSEHFEALGRFVRAFEWMVNNIRAVSFGVIGGTEKQQSLLARAFHHPALSAMPQFEIMRGMVTALVVEQRPEIDQEERDATLALLGQLADEVQSLTAMRNKLLHGTWYINSSGSDDQAGQRLGVSKPQWDKTGRYVGSPMKEVDDLNALIERCDDVALMLNVLAACCTTPDTRVSFNFRREGKTWRPLVQPMAKMRSINT